MRLVFVLLTVSLRLSAAYPTHDDDQHDGETSRKIIGQSVVTSVSVIMNGDGEAPQFTDAVGKTVARPNVPPQVASPINLLNPDRYEFYTFNDNGELVKRLMTLKEIQSIVANGNGAMISDNEPESQSVLLNTIPLSNQGAETKVQDIVDNVQNVLSREMENNKNISQIPSELLDTPDVSSSWSMILPAIFGNTGDEIMPHRPINMTPETEIVDTTTSSPKVIPTRKTTTKSPPAKIAMSSKTTQSSTAPQKKTTQISTTQQQKTTQTSAAPTTTVTKQQTTSSTKKQTVKAKPKPTTTRTTTVRTTEAPTETTSEEVAKTVTSRPSTLKATPTKNFVKKQTASAYKRPMTNSPIVIEKIPKKPLVVESKTEGIDIETMTTTQVPTTEMRVETTSAAPTTVVMKKITLTTRTEAPSTTTQLRTTTTTEMPKVPSTTKKIIPETTQMMMSMDQTTLSVSEEDRQDSAISQIIGSLQSDLFKNYERITTLNPPMDETTVNDSAMEKLGELNLVPDKVLLNDQLFIEEEEPIVKELPATTAVPEEIAATDAPSFERLEATTMQSKSEEISLENSEVMQTIEKLIQEQANGKTKVQLEKLDALGFDDDDETEIRVKGTLENMKKNFTHSDYITKAATVASILSTKVADEPTTTTVAPSQESDTTVPTILSEALSNVIQLMIAEQESKKTTQRPDEPTEFDLNKILHHYEDLNSQQDQLEALSMLSEKFVAVPTAQPEIEITTIPSVADNVSYETTVVKETSSVSMKKEETTKESEEVEVATTEAPDVTTTDPSREEFSTFFFIDNDEEETSDPLIDTLGDFTTEQFVGTEKRLSDRKEESNTTPASVESEEESSELVSEVLNAIGIASDEEDESSSTEKLKNTGESQESDEVESAISSLTSTLDKTLSTDVSTDFRLTSKIASSLISVADTISDTLNDDDESEEVITEIPTTITPLVKQEPSTTVKAFVAEMTPEAVEEAPELTEKISDITEKNLAVEEEVAATTEAAMEEVTTESQEATEKMMESDEASTEKEIATTTEQEIRERRPDRNSSSPMVQLSIIRKDNSLEEIDFITPPTPTSTKIPITEGNFIKIESIETTTKEHPKLSNLKHKIQEVHDNSFKHKTHEVHEHVRPIYIALRSTTTAKSSALPDVVVPSQATPLVEQTSHIEEAVATERVPLIEVTKTTESPIHLASTEDNLVEIKVQTKPTVAHSSSTEDHQPTVSQFQPNAQTIKNNIKNSQQLHQQPRPQSPPIDLSAAPEEALGLAASTANLNTDLSEFSKLCNELAFSFWKSITADGISQSRSVIISPFALTSVLSMIFLGARGQTSGEMNDLLRLDDMVSFNPHVVFRNISESIEQSRNSGIAAAAFVRELYSDRSKGKLLPYFKEKAQQFYGAHVEEVNFNTINDILRRRTNLLVKRHTYNKINEYLKTNNIWVNDPLAAVSANVFLTDCSGTTNSERDGEMFFQVSPAIRQRRLIPIPAAVYRSGFTAGYDPTLDATAVAFGDELHSTIMVMPGQQGSSIPGDNLERLENAFMDTSTDVWGRLLTTFMERPGLEVQIPRFSHRSLINTTYALQQMGLKDIFDGNKADLRGLTGAKTNELYFSDMMQINQFSTCGEDKIGDSHHIEIYPSPSLKRDVNDNDEDEEEDGKLEIASSDKSNMQYKSQFYDPIYDSRYINVPLPLRPRQARLPENPRLRFDRPFLYFVRHNPTGIILFMGRFNPRLLP